MDLLIGQRVAPHGIVDQARADARGVPVELRAAPWPHEGVDRQPLRAGGNRSLTRAASRPSAPR